MARTLIGISPWPVMKMMGIGNARPRELLLQLEPIQTGQLDVEHEASRTWVAAPVIQELPRRGVGSGRITHRFKRRTRLLRTESSSSTTYTVGVHSFMLSTPMIPRRRRRECETKRRSTPGILLGPHASAVARDDGATDGKPHAQTTGFGASERLEKPVHVFRSNAVTRVAHRDHDLRVNPSAAHDDDSIT